MNNHLPRRNGRAVTTSTATPTPFLPLVVVTDELAEERRLIEAVIRGDSAAFGSLVERHLGHALALALRVLRHREDAEDLVQDAFLAALRHIEDFDVQRPFWPWLSRIIVNRGLDLAAARSVRSTESLTGELADLSESPAADVERADFFARVRKAMASLPERRRLIVELFELQDFSVAEIAELLDTLPGTVRWHLHIGRRQLRQLLADERGASA